MLSERCPRASFRSAPHRTMWRTYRAARARCFEHAPRHEWSQRRSNLDHRAKARFGWSAGGVNARGPCGTHGRSAAKSVDVAEHRMKIQREGRVISEQRKGD